MASSDFFDGGGGGTEDAEVGADALEEELAEMVGDELGLAGLLRGALDFREMVEGRVIEAFSETGSSS